MLGFKLEVPRRDDGLKAKARPIYLDMQVRVLTHRESANTQATSIGNHSSRSSRSRRHASFLY